MVWERLKQKASVALVTCVALSLGGAGLGHAGFKPKHFEMLGAMPGSDGLDAFNQDSGFLQGYDANPSSRLARDIVEFDRGLAPGSILVKTSERKLYFVLPGGQAVRYPVGVGRQGFTWSGRNRVSRKAEWPDWRPPKVMIAREARKGHMLPEMMEGGPKNPLGARALYIGSTEFRIHGTTQPWSIGRAVSSGCIRMLNEHVIDLYDRVSVGATVVVER
jgi:lipoprotein-anchoring transpeptidase ErfK/SrfK